ncbi:hypothetical protein TNCV_2268131 [Trichonephila clavipes]|nr:hypothetical protein TNCV_2268131 [Trichonephila clavipes]
MLQFHQTYKKKKMSPRETILAIERKPVWRTEKLDPADIHRRFEEPIASSNHLQLKMQKKRAKRNIKHTFSKLSPNSRNAVREKKKNSTINN